MIPTAIDAFCGAGGLSLGLTWAGFDVRAAFLESHGSEDEHRCAKHAVQNPDRQNRNTGASENQGDDQCGDAGETEPDRPAAGAPDPPDHRSSRHERAAASRHPAQPPGGMG